MTGFFEQLPAEVLAEILGHLSPQDIMRLKLVDRDFRTFIFSSRLIQHRLDLHVAGFKYNPIAGVDLIEGQKAFHNHLSDLVSLKWSKKRTVNGLQAPAGPEFAKIVGDVHTLMADSLLLFTLESPLLGIAYKQWEMPLPPIPVDSYAFCPDADIIAFSGQEPQGDRKKAVIHLRSLSSGEHHPAAQHPTIECRTDAVVNAIFSTSISASRLAVLINMGHSTHMLIWDWKSAEVLYRLENKRYASAEFIDDYRLLASLKVPGDDFYDPMSILLINAEVCVGRGTPAQTSFRLTPYFNRACPIIHLERGGHKPSATDRLTTFYQDPAQRIAVLNMGLGCPLPYLAFRVEALVGLARGHEGREIEWDDWKKHVIIPSIEPGPAETWVSGCRLYHIKPGEDAGIEVYDFSARGRVGRLSGQDISGLGEVKCLQANGVKVILPWSSDRVDVLGGRCESVMFFRLKDGDGDSAEGKLCTWRF